LNGSVPDGTAEGPPMYVPMSKRVMCTVVQTQPCEV
jgi:hypothetical protein